jgi:MFS transporter, DHA1 family, inner membrane transport protein
MSPLLFALFLATFAIGTTEFAVVGLLPDIAASLDVSISRAGLLVSGYALGEAIGVPVIVALTSSQLRKRTLLQLCAIFVVGHALAALAPDYGWLMGARVLAAISHASFLGIAAIVAAGSHALGWRAAFWMPASPRSEASSFRQEVVALRRPQVLLAMAMSLLVCASTFAVFTYVAPLLLEDTGISAGALPIMLLLFGVGGAAGMVIGGRLGDWKPLESVAALSLAYAVFYLGLMAVIDSAALVGAAMILWGFLFLAPCVPLQTRVVKKAIDGQNLASTLNQSAFNVGNALGPTLGAIALSRGFDYRALPWIGSVLALTGAATALFSRALEGAEAVPVESERPRAPPSPSP